MNAFSNCALAFVEGGVVELPWGECDLDFDPEFPLSVLFDAGGCVGLLDLDPCLAADLPRLGGLFEVISILLDSFD
jgi:hypothetical protein